MNQLQTLLVAHMCHRTTELGTDGGLVSPSVYDTAQVLRFAPPPEGIWPAFTWLVSQQQADGGWGDPSMPLARDVPTLAVLLALHQQPQRAGTTEALRAGMQFLRRQAQHWYGPLPEDLPAAVEIVLPRLLHEAAAIGVELDSAPYAALLALGNKRQRQIQTMPAAAGTRAVYCWEGWGTAPDPALLDGSGGVGHSPAATAAWLRAAADQPHLAAEVATARRYMEQAQAATGTGVPGVVPTVWPIPHFEILFSLYVAAIAGVLDHPALADVFAPHLDGVERMLNRDGCGMSPFFQADGDDTAAALVVLAAANRPVSLAPLSAFRGGDHYYTYPHELQPSLSVTARAAHALGLHGTPDPRLFPFLRARQQIDGRWSGDKWNQTWTYSTLHAIIGLTAGRTPDDADMAAIRRAVQAMEDEQQPFRTGGWGSMEATAYGVLALRWLQRQGLLDEPGRALLRRVSHWLRQAYRPFYDEPAHCWIGKEVYQPVRLARWIILAALWGEEES